MNSSCSGGLGGTGRCIRELVKPEVELGDAGTGRFGEMGGERGKRAFLILRHQPRIDHIGGKNGGEAAFDSVLDHDEWVRYPKFGIARL